MAGISTQANNKILFLAIYFSYLAYTETEMLLILNNPCGVYHEFFTNVNYVRVPDFLVHLNANLHGCFLLGHGAARPLCFCDFVLLSLHTRDCSPTNYTLIFLYDGFQVCVCLYIEREVGLQSLFSSWTRIMQVFDLITCLLLSLQVFFFCF